MKGIQSLQQPGVSNINCAAMTWSEQTGAMYCRGRTRFVYESRQYIGPVCPIHVIRALILLALGCRNLEILIDETKAREYTENNGEYTKES